LGLFCFGESKSETEIANQKRKPGLPSRSPERGGERRLVVGDGFGGVAGLTWQRVDLDKRCVSLTSKTGKRLSFHVAKPMADYLGSLPSSDRPDACVFPKAAAMAEKHTGTISTKFSMKPPP